MSPEGVSTIIVNKQPEYEYIGMDTKYNAKTSTSSLKPQNENRKFSITSCSAYGSHTLPAAPNDERKFSITDCSAYGSTTFSGTQDNKKDFSISECAAYGSTTFSDTPEEETYETIN